MARLDPLKRLVGAVWLVVSLPLWLLGVVIIALWFAIDFLAHLALGDGLGRDNILARIAAEFWDWEYDNIEYVVFGYQSFQFLPFIGLGFAEPE